MPAIANRASITMLHMLECPAKARFASGCSATRGTGRENGNIFPVMRWDNISDTDIQELEGLFRQLYRDDE